MQSRLWDYEGLRKTASALRSLLSSDWIFFSYWCIKTLAFARVCLKFEVIIVVEQQGLYGISNLFKCKCEQHYWLDQLIMSIRKWLYLLLLYIYFSIWVANSKSDQVLQNFEHVAGIHISYPKHRDFDEPKFGVLLF